MAAHEGAQHPDRDAQFRCLNEQARDHQAPGSLGVVILDPPVLRAGQEVLCLLWFQRSGKVAVRATVAEAAS
jgi:hypothetical protein